MVQAGKASRKEERPTFLNLNIIVFDRCGSNSLMSFRGTGSLKGVVLVRSDSKNTNCAWTLTCNWTYYLTFVLSSSVELCNLCTRCHGFRWYLIINYQACQYKEKIEYNVRFPTCSHMKIWKLLPEKWIYILEFVTPINSKRSHSYMIPILS